MPGEPSTPAEPIRSQRASLGGLALAALAAASAWLAPVQAQGTGGTSRENELSEIRSRVLEFREQLAELDAFGSGLEAELERLRLDVQLQQQLVSEAAVERELADGALRASEARIEALASELDETRARLRRRVRALNRAAPSDWLRGFTTVRDPGDLFLYLRTLRYLARRDGRLVPRYRREQAELEAERVRLDERRLELTRSITREKGRLAALEAAARRQSLVAAALERERERLEREVDSLDDKERKLALLIAALGDPEEAALPGAPIQDFRGALDWPLAGEVAIPFGPKYEPRYKTSVPHNGIQITPSAEGADIATVFPGVVIFAAPFEGFGLTVVVHHARRVFSLYAGLEELEVSKGDVLVLADVLGRSGPDLYFELRVENRPEDPMEWLR